MQPIRIPENTRNVNLLMNLIALRCCLYYILFSIKLASQPPGVTLSKLVKLPGIQRRHPVSQPATDDWNNQMNVLAVNFCLR